MRLRYALLWSKWRSICRSWNMPSMYEHAKNQISQKKGSSSCHAKSPTMQVWWMSLNNDSLQSWVYYGLGSCQNLALEGQGCWLWFQTMVTNGNSRAVVHLLAIQVITDTSLCPTLSAACFGSGVYLHSVFSVLMLANVGQIDLYHDTACTQGSLVLAFWIFHIP